MGYFSGATNQNQGKYRGSVRFYRMVNTPFELGNYLLVRQAKKVYLACRESRMTAIMVGGVGWWSPRRIFSSASARADFSAVNNAGGVDRDGLPHAPHGFEFCRTREGTRPPKHQAARWCRLPAEHVVHDSLKCTKAITFIFTPSAQAKPQTALRRRLIMAEKRRASGN